MPARAAWKGFLQVHQLQIPVKTFTACSSQPEISLNQLHRGCGQRIRQLKVCPLHGEIESADIISGYAHGEGQYLSLENFELEALQPDDGKAITVDCFIRPEEVDAAYHSGRTYYVVPDGPPGQRPFGVLRDGMQKLERHGVSRIVMHRRESLVLLRPVGKLIAMTVLEYPQKVRQPTDYEGEVAQTTTGPQEQQLIGQLIEALTDSNFDVRRYRDPYIDGLNGLIEHKLAEQGTVPGSTLSERPQETEDEDAMVAALRASLAAAGVDHLPAPVPSFTQRTVADSDAAPVPKIA